MKAGWFAILAAGTIVTGCNNAPDRTVPSEQEVSIRNLADTDVAGEAKAGYVLEGDLMATPSDTRSQYFLLRQRRTPTGSIVAVIRQEHGDRIAYARTETDCRRRLFHVLGVGETRGQAEARIAYDGPLRSIEGLPLRQEMATAVCDRGGTPLAAG